MAMPELFEVDHSGTAYVLVRARTTVDAHSAPALREALREVLREVFREGRRFLAVDLTGVAAYGSQGFSPLLGAVKSCRDRGGDLYLVGASDMVRRVLSHDMRGPVECYGTRGELDAALLGRIPAEGTADV